MAKYIPKKKAPSGVDRTFAQLMEIAATGKGVPSYRKYLTEYKGKEPKHIFYPARRKAIQESEKAPGKPLVAKKDSVFILYSSDTNPTPPEVLTEMKKVLLTVLEKFARYNGIPLEKGDVEVKTYAPSGWEIRMNVR